MSWRHRTDLLKTFIDKMPYANGAGNYGRVPSGRGRDERGTEGGGGGGGGGGAPTRGFEPDDRVASGRGGGGGRGGPPRGQDPQMMEYEVGGGRGGGGAGGRGARGQPRGQDAQMMEYDGGNGAGGRGGRGAAGGNAVVPFGRGEVERAAGGVAWEIMPFGEFTVSHCE